MAMTRDTVHICIYINAENKTSGPDPPHEAVAYSRLPSWFFPEKPQGLPAKKKMQINNIYLQGKYTVEEETKADKKKEKLGLTKVFFYNNPLFIRQSSFSLPVSRNIRETLSTPSLKEALKHTISRHTKRKVCRLSIRITNVQQSFNLELSSKEIVSTFVPSLHAEFPLANVQITQEQNSPSPISIEQLLNTSDSPSYICLKFNIPSAQSSLKLQISKKKYKHCSATLILSRFNENTGRLVEYLKRQSKSGGKK